MIVAGSPWREYHRHDFSEQHLPIGRHTEHEGTLQRKIMIRTYPTIKGSSGEPMDATFPSQWRPIYMIWKGRVRRLAKEDAVGQALFIAGLFGLPA